MLSKEHDNVNNPKHYAGSTSLECIECMRVTFGSVATYDSCLCNAFKYLWRYKNKNGAEDIKKQGGILTMYSTTLSVMEVLKIVVTCRRK